MQRYTFAAISEKEVMPKPRVQMVMESEIIQLIVILFKMSDDQKKTVYLGLAAAGLALGAYVAYQYWVKSREPVGL